MRPRSTPPPGIPPNPAEGFRWVAESARLGKAAAMLNLGSMCFNFPKEAMRDPAEGYRWLMCAALTTTPLKRCERGAGPLCDGRRPHRHSHPI